MSHVCVGVRTKERKILRGGRASDKPRSTSETEEIPRPFSLSSFSPLLLCSLIICFYLSLSLSVSSKCPCYLTLYLSVSFSLPFLSSLSSLN
ncbi:hypothetical protein CSUI_006296 [Cystoisospora suis]|uniref:Transmembrane protein n=1 Tax=Cystoisospora suis TaxID=483139 RepID=A0A2C6KUK2_9APIC|nr:hypothetical protein CSUI_006296 [Cystoisospora suis]